MANQKLTADRLREVLSYDPDTGRFSWASNYHGGRLAKKRVGYTCPNTGHISIRVFKRSYEAHRLAWFYMTGRWPKDTVDHINRVPGDNRWRNLRSATKGEQLQNQKTRKDSTHGYRGLELSKQGLWRARLSVGRKRIHLGYFKTPEDAMKARIAGERRHFTHSPACEPQAESHGAPAQQGASESASRRS